MEKISLKAARANADKTQAELAKAVGVSKNKIINWEKGRATPRQEQLERYCAACGCRPEDVDCAVLILSRT